MHYYNRSSSDTHGVYTPQDEEPKQESFTIMGWMMVFKPILRCWPQAAKQRSSYHRKTGHHSLLILLTRPTVLCLSLCWPAVHYYPLAGEKKTIKAIPLWRNIDAKLGSFIGSLSRTTRSANMYIPWVSSHCTAGDGECETLLRRWMASCPPAAIWYTGLRWK